MGDSYILKISSLSHTFSLIESGVDFSFKSNLIENDQLTNILKVLKVGDTFFCEIGDYIKSYFSIKNIDDKDVILNKIIEVAKGYKIEDINIVKKLEEALIYKIDDNLKAEILKSMSPNTKEEKPYTPLDYTPCKDKIKSYNRIVFGAPGTGKSFQLNKDSEVFIDKITDNSERIKNFYSEAKKINSETNSSYKLINLGFDNADLFFDLFSKFDTHEKMAKELDLYNDKGNLAVGSLSFLHWGADLAKEKNCIPSFKRTDITDSLAEEFVFQPAEN